MLHHFWFYVALMVQIRKDWAKMDGGEKGTS